MSRIRAEFLGRNYDLACDVGQEEQLQALAAELGERLHEMQQRFDAPNAPKMAESMLWIMTSLTLLDEIHDLRRESRYWQQAAINVPPAPFPTDLREKEKEQVLADRLNVLADRLEHGASA